MQANAVLAQYVKDDAGVNVLQGKGGVGGDLLVVSVRSAGAMVITNGKGVVEYRPWPAGGEGLGAVSVSQTSAQFVP